jgi:hypothetical protein
MIGELKLIGTGPIPIAEVQIVQTGPQGPVGDTGSPGEAGPPGEVTTQQLLDSLDFVNIADFGAVAGTVSEAQRIANAAAIQAALDTRKNVRIPNGTWQIYGNITRACHGQAVFGDNEFLSIISQFDPAADGIRIRNDSTVVLQGQDLIFGGEVRDLSIIGPGKATSTGRAIDASGSSTQFNGDWPRFRNLYLRGFNNGLRTQGVGQIRAMNLTITQNNTGVDLRSGSSNSHQLIGLTVVNSDTGIRIEGTGAVIIGGDYGNNSVTDFDVIAGAHTEIIGGNFETSSSSRVVIVRSTANASIKGGRFLRPGVSTPPILAEGTSAVYVERCLQTGHAAGTALVEKAHTNAMVSYGAMLSLDSNLTQAGRMILDNSQEFILGEAARYYNSLASPSANVRGVKIFSVGLSNFFSDAYGQYIRRADGTFALDWWSNEKLEETLVHSSTTLHQSVINTWTRFTHSTDLQTTQLPASAGVDRYLKFTAQSAAGLQINQVGANQQIRSALGNTTTGTGGSMTIPQHATVVLKCTSANNIWTVVEIIGTPTFA